jgi:curved DNA-binding protein CbpA
MASKNLDMKEDLYVTLGLDDGGPHVTLAFIRKAYHKRALQIHPDKSKNEPFVATKEFQNLQRAYEILSDENARGSYDELQRIKKERVEKERAKKERAKKERWTRTKGKNAMKEPVAKKKNNKYNPKDHYFEHIDELIASIVMLDELIASIVMYGNLHTNLNDYF